MSKYHVPMETDPSTISGKIMQQITFGATVLEFGCATGRMTQYMTEQLDCSVSIVELDEKAYQMARAFAVDGCCGDIETLNWYTHFQGKQFDYILFADVLEHLRDPEKILRKAKDLLTEGGKVIVSLPNIGHNDILVNLYYNRFQYTSLGLLDDTHIHFWGKHDLQSFVNQAGFDILVMDGVNVAPFTTEQSVDSNIPVTLKNALELREGNTLYQFFLVLQTQEWMVQHNLSMENRLPCDTEEQSAYFYWDLGEGFQAGQFLRLAPSRCPGGKLRFYCNSIPADCRKIRFDPTLNRLCIVSDLHITTNNGSCSYLPLNGVCVNGVTAFANTNPQIEIPLSGNTQWIEIEVAIQVCSGYEFCEVFSAVQKYQLAVQQMLLEKNLLAAQMENDRNAANQLQDRLTEELEKEKEVAKQLQDRLTEELEKEKEIAKHLQDRLETKLQEEKASEKLLLEQQAAHDAQMYTCKQQLKASEANLVAAGQEIAHLTAQTQDMGTHIQNLTVQAQDMNHHIQNLTAQSGHFQNCFNAVVNSRSWKITAPLRGIVRVVKSTKIGSIAFRFLRSLRYCGVKCTLEKAWNKIRSKCMPKRKKLRKADDISFRGFVNCAKSNGALLIHPEMIRSYDRKKHVRKILFISHEMDLTGAPIVLQNFAMSAVKNGDLAIVASPRAGKLCERVQENHIPAVVFDGVYSTDFVRRYASLFDVVVVNTIVGSPVIDLLADTATPVLWWIHEAEDSYYKEMLERLPKVQPDNVSIYCGGSYAEKVLLSHRPSFRTEQLLYYTVDTCRNDTGDSPIEKDDRLVFAMVGTMQGRKGPDILADAILQLPENIVRQCYFLFIGRPVDDFVIARIDAACKQYPQNVDYWNELAYSKLLALYKDVDCLICPSRDDPMPCTITEVLLLSTPVICSENTGYAPILKKMESGRVFTDNDPAKLAAEIRIVVENPDILKSMRTQARQTYETYFSEAVFDINSRQALADTIAVRDGIRRKSVSVVIPAYNAGEEGKLLFERLRNQKGLDELEIIVVDSGSKDDTVAVAKQYGCQVIQIPNEEFSHSYARNLGAQHVKTDYILFMTQDAVPISDKWISGMVSAVQKNSAVAASCLEIPRPECDLYGKVCGFVHNSFMEILHHDRIMEKPDPWTFESSRKNGQLNDVACLVKRSVFERYQYRGNYAEDLDLGLRLIKDNYRTMLLASEPVMHSHTRAAMYHFRRAIVDVAALKRIMPEYPIRDTAAQQVYDRTLTCAFMTFHAVHVLADRLKEEVISPARLRKELWAIYAEAEAAAGVITKEVLRASISRGLPCEDGGMLKLTEEILEKAPQLQFDSLSFMDVGAFITDQTVSYLEEQETQITQHTRMEVCDTMIKRLGQIIGLIFAEYSITATAKDAGLEQMIRKYSQGI